MKKSMKIMLGVVVAAVAIGGLHYYKQGSKSVENTEEVEEIEKVTPVGPSFNADSAYSFVKAQCDFGPRDMNSRGHERCAQWIVKKFKEYGCRVTTQDATLTGYDGTKLKAEKRILICAHWDSRPWADNDPDSTNWHKPILAANDAASGVAVMLELARIIHNNKGDKALNAQLGIDFVCFDAEDWGTPQWANTPDNADSWALGAQYWSKNLPRGYEARYGILLDMVGGVGARFYREGMSMQYASAIVNKVWRAAKAVGFGSYFPQQDGGMITDDHVPINQFAKIPTIDIIPYYPDCQQSSFGPTWHTLADNMENIDKNTLKAVGQTMVQVIYSEK